MGRRRRDKVQAVKEETESVLVNLKGWLSLKYSPARPVLLPRCLHPFPNISKPLQPICPALLSPPTHKRTPMGAPDFLGSLFLFPANHLHFLTSHSAGPFTDSSMHVQPAVWKVDS